MDSYLIDRIDRVAGKLQERGVPLPWMLEHAGTATIVALVAWVLSLALEGHYVSATLIALINTLMLHRLLSEIKEYRSDIGRMDVLSVFKKYCIKAMTERHEPSGRIVRILTAIMIAISAGWIALMIYEGEAIFDTLCFFLHMLTLSIYSHLQCAMPRPPKICREEHDYAEAGI